MTTQERVRQFIVQNFYVADPTSLRDDTSFLDAGVIDSTGVLELVTFLETELGVTVADDELLPQNLDSLAAVAAFIARKQAS